MLSLADIITQKPCMNKPTPTMLSKKPKVTCSTCNFSISIWKFTKIMQYENHENQVLRGVADLGIWGKRSTFWENTHFHFLAKRWMRRSKPLISVL